MFETRIVSGDEADCNKSSLADSEISLKKRSKKLLLFSGNDYLGLSSHPTISNAAVKVS